ncbi:hypothetical protein [Microbacterium pumilum]|uniref:Integral membrane protein n=1 Tax=Microbacterium pumilum TaxID=344165 RepID=A0ABP5E6T4_9MICO
MADEPLTDADTEHSAWARLPAAARVGVVYLLARIVTTVFFLMAANLSGFESRFGPEAGLGDLVLGWDSRWYWIIAEVGYPSQLPLTDSGVVAENQWAFMPIYPYLAKYVSLPFGGQWVVGAFLVSVAAGFGASLVLYRMLRDRIDAGSSMWAVAFFAAGPLAGLFQVGYAESLYLLWLFLALWCVMRRRYAWLYLLIPLMAFTRPGVLAFALFLGLFGIWRWISRRREQLAGPEIVQIVALGLLAVLMGFSWQLLAGWVTGDSGAYLSTELAWRRNWIPGDAAFAPFEGFLAGIEYWFGTVWSLTPPIGYVVVGASLVALTAVLLFEPHVRRLGVELRLWSASYLVYLLLVFFPQSSIFRLLVPLSPLWGAVALPRSRLWRVGVLVAGLVGQWWWIYNMYALGNTNLQVP